MSLWPSLPTVARLPTWILAGAAVILAADGGKAVAEEESRTWIDASGQHKSEAALVGVEVLLKTKDGQEIRVPIDKLSKPDRDYVREWVSRMSGSGAVPKPSSERLRDSAPERSPSARDPYLTEVEVTGVGLTVDKAEQHAYTRAIEKAVGVLIDSETLVENDQIVRDKVLTFSRGFVQKFEVLRNWEEEGLQYVQARAAVAVDQLLGKLDEVGVSVRPLSGKDLRLKLLQEIEAEENAAEMFAKIMKDYRLNRLLSLQVADKWEVVKKDSTHAVLKLNAEISADTKQWERFLSQLEPFLARVAVKRSALRFVAGRLQPDARMLAERLPGTGTLLVLFDKMNRTATTVEWEAFRVPESFHAVMQDVERREFRLVWALLDREGNIIKRFDRESFIRKDRAGSVVEVGRLATRYWFVAAQPLTGSLQIDNQLGPAWWLGPVPFQRNYVLLRGFTCLPAFQVEETVQVSLDQLAHVENYAAFLEEVQP